MAFIDLPHRIEYARYGSRSAGPTLVLLHHGLGSVSAWRAFPDRLSAALRMPVVAYSRRGHGRSVKLPAAARTPDFMHREAREDLPALLRALDIEQPVLVGHSDGASIALIYAAEGLQPRPLALALLAPHVLVEACTLESARAARRDYESGALRAALAQHHDDVDGAFGAWSATWLSPAFRDWNIASLAAEVNCPLLLVQGLADEYGTTLHVEHVAATAPGPTRSLLFAGCGHLPERERSDDVIGAIGDLLGQHDGDHVPPRIFHLASPAELRDGMRDHEYHPASLQREGFVHCAAGLTVALAVAEDLFAGTGEPLLLIELDTARLGAPVRMEAAAPVPGMRAAHRRLARRFPHVYGPLERAAIARIHRLERHGQRFALPATADPFAELPGRDTIPSGPRRPGFS